MRPLTGRIGADLGPRIRLLRERRGLTASDLARRAGIGKGSLSKIESGQGNPTVDTLGSLAAALHLPLSDLLTEPPLTATMHRPGTAFPAEEITRDLLKRIGAGHLTEVWHLRMPPRSTFDGIAHAPGTSEHLLVSAGELVAGPKGEQVRLGTGDFLSFAGDQPHDYRTTDHPADVTVLIISPSSAVEQGEPGLTSH